MVASSSQRRLSAGAGAIYLASASPPTSRHSQEKPEPEATASDAEGLCFAFGFNGHGQLGTGDEVERTGPRPIRPLLTEGIRVVTLASGSAHTVAIDEHGNSWGWGSNSYGQLGTGDCASRPRPYKFDCDGQRVVGAAAGYRHTVLCTARGRAFACGSNANGQLGWERTTRRPRWVVSWWCARRSSIL